MFDQLAGLGFFEVAKVDDLGVDELAGPAVEFLQGMGTGDHCFDAGAVLDDVAQVAEDVLFVEAIGD